MKTKTAYVIGAVIILVFVALGMTEFVRAQMPYYQAVAQVKAAPAGTMVQFIGSLVPGKAGYSASGEELLFTMSDKNSDTLNVRFKGVKPSGFDTAPKVIVRGSFNGTDFLAEEVQTKCPSKYQSK